MLQAQIELVLHLILIICTIIQNVLSYMILNNLVLEVLYEPTIVHYSKIILLDFPWQV